MLINGGAAVTNEASVVVEMNAVDALSPVTEMRLSFDGTNWLPWTTYAASVGATLTHTDTLNTIWAQFKDGAGNASSTYSDSIFMDATGPTGSISIEGGAAYTGARAVTISSTATDAISGVASMRLRDEGGAWGAWLTYATSSTWTLPAGDGAKRVEAQFRDGSGNPSAVVSATITLDTTPPDALVAVAGGAVAVNHADVDVALVATDAGSGVAEFRLRNDDGDWTDWASARASEPVTLTGGDGLHRVYAQFKDGVGNLSAETYDDVLLDLTAPAGSLAVQGGRPLVLPWQDVVCEPAADDGAGGSGVTAVQFSTDAGASWTPPAPMAPEFALARPDAEDAPVTVLARWRDLAGNVSEPASATAYVVAAPVQGLAYAKSLRGALPAGADIDAYSVELVAGDVLSVRVSAKPAAKRGDFSAELDLFTPSHEQAVDGRWPAGSGKPGIAKFAAPATGTYVVVVRASGADAAAGGTYTLVTKIKRPKSTLRLSGFAQVVQIGATPTASLVFPAAEGESVSGSVKILVPTSFQIVSPDGRIDVFFLLPTHGVAHFKRPLTGGTGDFELRAAAFAAVPYSLTIKPPKPAARADEVPPAGGR
jgi:hypothetical protein